MTSRDPFLPQLSVILLQHCTNTTLNVLKNLVLYFLQYCFSIGSGITVRSLYPTLSVVAFSWTFLMSVNGISPQCLQSLLMKNPYIWHKFSHLICYSQESQYLFYWFDMVIMLPQWFAFVSLHINSSYFQYSTCVVCPSFWCIYFNLAFFLIFPKLSKASCHSLFLFLPM